MPADVTFSIPHGNFGPGLALTWGVSPPSSGATKLVIEAFLPTHLSVPFYRETFTGNFNNQATVTPMVSTGVVDLTTYPGWAYSDDSVSMAVYTLDNSLNVVDFVTKTVTWENQEGIGRQLALKTTTGGLTTGQATQLTTVEANTNAQQTQWTDYTTVTLPSLQDVLNGITTGITSTITGAAGAVGRTIGDIFSGRTFDLITTFDLGAACNPDFIDENIGGGTFFGVQIQATDVPDYYAFTGPADDWSQQVIATVEIVRGGNTIHWHGMHTRNYMLYPLPGVPFFELELAMPSAPGDYRVRVVPNVGVCVAAQLLQFP
jgi:hypothetical protein